MSAQVPDDNLVTRRKNITKGIEEIREKKAEIAKALRGLGVSQQDGNSQENKSFIKQLVDAYDVLSAQETQYMDILKTIVGIHEQATLDIANDFEKKMEEEEKRLKEGKLNADEKKSLENKPEEENGEVSGEVSEALLELKTVSEAAIAASELNEKLVERLQMQKKKKSAMMEVRTKKAKDLDEEATRVRAEVMEKINKMSSIKKSTVEQTKELAALKKQCLELGLALDYTNEVGEDAHRAVADDSMRVPTIQKVAGSVENDEAAKERRRQEIRENIAREMEEKEKVNTLIREKLAAMDARKKRLQQIRQMLEQQKKQEEQRAESIAVSQEAAPIASPENEEAEDVPPPLPTSPPPNENQEREDLGTAETSIDEILNNAKANLSNLTAMRERLENIQSTGGADLNEEDVLLLQSLDQVVDIEETVRESFQDAFKDEPKRSVGIEARLTSIEVTVMDNRRILMDMERSSRARKIEKFCRLSKPADLRHLGELLVQLAEMKEEPKNEQRTKEEEELIITNSIHSILNDLLL